MRLLRFRGHRYISIRQFDRAVADLERAVTLAPSSFDVTYHLALAHYLRGEFDAAAAVYRSCLDASAPGPLPPGLAQLHHDPRHRQRPRRDHRLALPQRCGAPAATTRRGPCWRRFVAGLKVGENEAYYTALRFYSGEVDRGAGADAERPQNDNRLVTVGYGIAVHYGANGDGERACELLQRIAAEPNWNAFGVIAAEVDLARTPGALPLTAASAGRIRTTAGAPQAPGRCVSVRGLTRRPR